MRIIIVIAAALLLIDSFLPWYDVDFGIGSITRSGWESPGAMWSSLAVLMGLTMGALATLSLFGNRIPPPTFAALGGGALACVVLKLLNESSYLGSGFYVGIFLALLLAIGGFVAMLTDSAGQDKSA